MAKATEALLESAEAPLSRPEFLPTSVIWFYNDCLTDKSAGNIIVEGNKGRPKMQLAVRRPDGTILSNPEYADICRATNLITRELVKCVSSDPLFAACAGDSRLWTRTFLKTNFYPHYHQALLDLEADQKLLRLCAAHWKADTLIGQALMWRNDNMLSPA